MSVLYIVLPLALLIGAAAVAAFIWMVRGGQLDDLESPAHRILHDDAEVRRPSAPTSDAPPSAERDEARPSASERDGAPPSSPERDDAPPPSAERDEPERPPR